MAKRKNLCVCGDTSKHLPHCPYNEIGVDFSDLKKVLKEMEDEYGSQSKSRKSRDPKRIPKILKRLERLWKKHPDLRLTQLIWNATEGDMFYIEDEELIKKLKRFYKT